MKLAPLALLLTLTTSAIAQTFTDPANLRGERVTPSNGQELPIDQSEAQGGHGLAQLLRKLNTRASILNIVAHPDDEDGGMLTLYSRGLGARVADLSLTRGEGGQNAVTGDFEDALGLLRTQELLSNDRYTGVTQMFGTEVDFGFSKTKEEAFAKWTHERVLYDAVRAIRIFRPLVITATFIGGVTDGHGQHQVSGEIAQEAFKAAADPNVFPDQIAEGLLPWQALQVYARVPSGAITGKGLFDYATNQYTPARFTNYVTGQVTTTIPSADVVVHEGNTDPLLTPASANPADLPPALTKQNPTAPLSYVQFARIGLGLQRSQIGPGVRNAPSGAFDVSYHLYGSAGVCLSGCHPRRGSTSSIPTQTPSSIPTQTLSSRPESARTGAPIGRSLPEWGGVADVAERPAAPPASPQPSEVSSTTSTTFLSDNQVPRGFSLGSHGPSPESGFSPQGMPSPSTHGPAPTARPITAQSEALGKPSDEPARAESLIQNPALTTQPNFFTGINTTLEGIADLAPNAPQLLHHQLARMTQEVATATSAFNPQNPTTTAPALKDALQTCDALIGLMSSIALDNVQKQNVLHELRIKRVQLNEALALALNLHIESTAQQTNIVAGTESPIETRAPQLYGDASAPKALWLENSLHRHLDLIADAAQAAQQAAAGQPPRGQRIVFHTTTKSSFTTPVTRPYFYRDNIEQPVYKLRDPALRNAPQTPAPLTAWATVHYQGAEITLGRIVHSGLQPISIVPPISIASSPAATVLPIGQTQTQLIATLTNDASTPANINVQSPHNWTIEAKAVPAPATDPTHSIDFFLHPSTTFTDPQIFHVTAQTPDHQTYSESFRPVGYPGLISTNDFTPATTRIVPVDLKLPEHHRIAYLPGTGDAVPEALASIGLTPAILAVSDLTASRLSEYDTVILGVRTYNAHPDLHGAPTQALLDYARNGGNVLLQYQSAEFTAADAPYPLTLGYAAEKVVDETAPVQLLLPDALPRSSTNRYPDPSASSTNRYPEASASGLIAREKEGVLTPGYALLTIPNQISPADFDHWIEERGHGFLSSWDIHYTALTETHDPGGPETAPQLSQLGGLITTPLGKGRWTYCAFALYRQLPEAVPGAYRLFVNLITPPTP